MGQVLFDSAAPPRLGNDLSGSDSFRGLLDDVRILDYALAPSDGLLTVREVVEVLEVRGNRAYVRGTIVDGDIVVADGIHKATPGAPVILAQVI